LFVDAMLVPCAFYLIAKKCASKPEFLGKLYLVAVIGIIAFGALGLCEAATGRNILDYGEPELDIFRVNGPMRMAEDYGLVMSMLMLFSFAMARLRPLRSVGPGYQRLCSLIGLLAVANTLTRGIWLGLGLGWLVQFARRKTLLFLVVIPFLAFFIWMAFAFVLPNLSHELWETRINNRRTIHARLATYQSALAMFYDHPLLGVGFGAFPEAWERFPDRYFKEYEGEDSVSTPHNFALSLLAEMGLAGGVAYSLLLIQIFRFSLRLATRAKAPFHRAYAEAMISITVAYLAAGLGLDFMRNIDFVNKIYFIFAGTLSGLVDLPVARPKPSSVQEPHVLLREELLAVGRE